MDTLGKEAIENRIVPITAEERLDGFRRAPHPGHDTGQGGKQAATLAANTGMSAPLARLP
jgi:hypothetical protein